MIQVPQFFFLWNCSVSKLDFCFFALMMALKIKGGRTSRHFAAAADVVVAPFAGGAGAVARAVGDDVNDDSDVDVDCQRGTKKPS